MQRVKGDSHRLHWIASSRLYHSGASGLLFAFVHGCFPIRRRRRLDAELPVSRLKPRTGLHGVEKFPGHRSIAEGIVNPGEIGLMGFIHPDRSVLDIADHVGHKLIVLEPQRLGYVVEEEAIGSVPTRNTVMPDVMHEVAADDRPPAFMGELR